MAETTTRRRDAIFGDHRARMSSLNITVSPTSVTSRFHCIDNVTMQGSGTVGVTASVPVPGGNGPITYTYSGGGAQNAVGLLLLTRG